jgi:hypothetical protein
MMSGLAPLTEAEVKAFVDDWYLDKLDSHAPVEDILPLVADEGLEMVLPETTLHGVGDFRDWYERIINTFFDEVHTIKEVGVATAGDKADVKVVVNWQAHVWQPPASKSKWLGFDAYQTWEVKRSPTTGRVVITRYVVDRFEPMPGSSTL